MSDMASTSSLDGAAALLYEAQQQQQQQHTAAAAAAAVEQQAADSAKAARRERKKRKAAAAGLDDADDEARAEAKAAKRAAKEARRAMRAAQAGGDAGEAPMAPPPSAKTLEKAARKAARHAERVARKEEKANAKLARRQEQQEQEQQQQQLQQDEEQQQQQQLEEAQAQQYAELEAAGHPSELLEHLHPDDAQQQQLGDDDDDEAKRLEHEQQLNEDQMHAADVAAAAAASAAPQHGAFPPAYFPGGVAQEGEELVEQPAPAPLEEVAQVAAPQRAALRNPFLARAAAAAAPQQPVAPALGLDASQFPPGFDFAAMASYLARSAGTQQVPQAVPGPSSEGAAAAAEAASASQASLLQAIADITSAPGYLPPPPPPPAPARRPMPDGDTPRAVRPSGKRSSVLIRASKEATIEDAAGLTHEAMLCEKLYEPQQLKWLREAYGLTWKTGRYSKTEDDSLDEAIEVFKATHGMSAEDMQSFLSSRRADQAELYTDFFLQLGRKLGDRPQRNLRTHVIQRFHPDAGGGPWTEEETNNLMTAVEEHGRVWTKIGKIVGRVPRDCKVKWERETVPGGAGRNKGMWSKEEVTKLREAVMAAAEEHNLDPHGTGLPWNQISAVVGTRTALQCMKSWNIASAAERRMAAGVHPNWMGDRDNYALLKRLYKQEDAMRLDDETAVRWAEVADDEFIWDSLSMQRYYRYLREKYVDTCDPPPQGFKATLDTIWPVVERKHQEWVASGSQVHDLDASRKRQKRLVDARHKLSADGSSAGAGKKAKPSKRAERQQARDNDVIESDEEVDSGAQQQQQEGDLSMQDVVEGHEEQQHEQHLDAEAHAHEYEAQPHELGDAAPQEYDEHHAQLQAQELGEAPAEYDEATAQGLEEPQPLDMGEAPEGHHDDVHALADASMHDVGAEQQQQAYDEAMLHEQQAYDETQEYDAAAQEQVQEQYLDENGLPLVVDEQGHLVAHDAQMEAPAEYELDGVQQLQMGEQEMQMQQMLDEQQQQEQQQQQQMQQAELQDAGAEDESSESSDSSDDSSDEEE